MKTSINQMVVKNTATVCRSLLAKLSPQVEALEPGALALIQGNIAEMEAGGDVSGLAEIAARLAALCDQLLAADSARANSRPLPNPPQDEVPAGAKAAHFSDAFAKSMQRPISLLPETPQLSAAEQEQRRRSMRAAGEPNATDDAFKVALTRGAHPGNIGQLQSDNKSVAALLKETAAICKRIARK